ncbi:hypothetical protein [Streptomyces boncukensis]|uniref:Secreted protein n=1 Tax=Streptomyces boncukensis TaxID=2711219 RepID=A0A6G4X5Y6_9ACTN|nr:hypothetical protein [Streptomyces boncukensis]NGO72154.1 hypothetical protein [Streptomyces boncukensis]
MPHLSRFLRSTPAKAAGVLVSALTVAALTAAPASAAEGSIDGTIGAEGRSCTWTDGVTSDTAPNDLTVDRSTINTPGGNLSCQDVEATLNNDPTVSFDDNAGTATADLLDISVTVLGVNCRYQATDLSVQRDGDSRSYAGSADVPLHEGSFLCPDPASVDASFTFH